MASAAKNVSQQLNEYTNVLNPSHSSANGAMIEVGDLEEISKGNGDQIVGGALSGMYFDETPPEGGKTAHSVWLFYSNLNQIFWRYDEESGSFLRWQNDTDANNFNQATDRLTEDPVAASNVVMLFAEHEAHAATLIDINLLYIKRGKAIIYRDGMKYDAYWTTASEEYEKTTGKLRPIRFVDAQGNPFPLKPGQTWVEIIPQFTPYWETVDDVLFHRLINGDRPGSGYWAFRVYAP